MVDVFLVVGEMRSILIKPKPSYYLFVKPRMNRFFDFFGN